MWATGALYLICTSVGQTSTPVPVWYVQIPYVYTGDLCVASVGRFPTKQRADGRCQLPVLHHLHHLRYHLRNSPTALHVRMTTKWKSHRIVVAVAVAFEGAL